MDPLNRRDAVTLAAGFVVGTGVGAVAPAEAHAGPKVGEAKDTELASARQNLSMFMLIEEVTLQLNGDGRSRDLVITSARDEALKPFSLKVRSAALTVFRADPDKDDFTKTGGVYWTFKGNEGKSQFKKPGALILVVRDHKDTVRFYTLMRDLRC